MGVMLLDREPKRASFRSRLLRVLEGAFVAVVFIAVSARLLIWAYGSAISTWPLVKTIREYLSGLF